MEQQVKTFNPKTDFQIFDNLIKYAIAPRPICFASTIDENGIPNLSPFSYFNFVSQNPPVCVFSPLRRMRDGSTKHTLDNIEQIPEVVINIVNYSLVQQQSLASTEYPYGVNEFEKSGLTAIPSVHIRPFRVKESPIQLECKVQQIIPIAEGKGAGNLVLAEIICMHVNQELLDENNDINQADLDLVARLGGNWYCRVTADNLFEIPKPLRNLGIGVDQLPASIRNSNILTGNHLGQLANVEFIPELDENIKQDQELLEIYGQFKEQEFKNIAIHQYVAKLLDLGKTDKAWQVLLTNL